MSEALAVRDLALCLLVLGMGATLTRAVDEAREVGGWGVGILFVGMALVDGAVPGRGGVEKGGRGGE